MNRRDVDAFAVPLLIAVVAVVVVVVGIGYFLFYSDNGYFETSNEFGSWQEEIFIEYADGSETTLKAVQSQFLPFSVTYQGQEIVRAGLRVNAQVSGTGFDNAVIDLNNYGYIFAIYAEGYGPELYANEVRSSDTITVPLGMTQEVYSHSMDIDSIMSSFSEGLYHIKFLPVGSCRYRGDPDGDWQSVSLPTSRTMDVNVESGSVPGTIVVTFSYDPYSE